MFCDSRRINIDRGFLGTMVSNLPGPYPDHTLITVFQSPSWNASTMDQQFPDHVCHRGPTIHRPITGPGRIVTDAIATRPPQK
jgi:hypothetical protein